MKTALKQGLSRAGIFPLLDSIRRLPQAVRWIRNGCVGAAPPPIKRRIIAAYLRRHRLRKFIETGTYLGDTLAHIASNREVECISIELADELAYKAQRRFQSWPNVTLYHGDSGRLLPELVYALDVPALFWLDGHYSGGITAIGEIDTPISTELQAILESPVKGHVILIDDARCFDGTAGYPFLDELFVKVRQYAEYEIDVSADIIRISPCTYHDS